MSARTSNKTKSYGGSWFELGSNNIECDRTGFKIKASMADREWNNLVVRDQSWEQRQPIDFLRGLPDKQAPSVSRPGTGDDFLEPGDVTWDDL